MRQQSYFRVSRNDNICLEDVPLMVNCAGVSTMPCDFGVNNCGRRIRQDFYLQYLVSGEMDALLSGESTVMRPGEAVLHFPHTPFQYGTRGNREASYYWVHFTGSEAESLVRRCGFRNQRPVMLGMQAALTAQFSGIFRELIERDDYFELSLNNRLAMLLVEMARSIQGKRENRQQDERIFQAIASIHQTYQRPLTVEELAAQAHLSPSRFRALFHQHTGVSPMEYLTALRLRQARSLLEQTSMPVAQVAFSVGYADPLYFSRLFRQHTGLSPSECRGRG